MKTRNIPAAIPLTNSVMNRFAELHGGYQQAWDRATRDMLPMKPAQDQQCKLDQRVLVINDLHIGPGFDPVMKKYDASDDFTATQERQLVSMLTREWVAAGLGNENLTHPAKAKAIEAMKQLKWANGQDIDLDKIADLNGEGSYKLTLNINGDFVDFLQTTNARPHLPFPDGVNKSGAPLNTPANSITILNTIREGHPEVFRALAVHLALGHEIDLVPGNHDRHFWNKHVWEGEVEFKGRVLKGFVPMMADEMRELGLPEKDIQAALGRLNRKAFAVYADKWVDHGDMADKFNRVQRPLGELFEPSGMHEEMSMALGDYGVRNGFNKIEPLDPSLDAIDDKALFFKRAIRHPMRMLGLVTGFLKAAKAEGHEKSAKADMDTRIADLNRLVDEHPYVMEQLNALRPEGEKLTKDEVKAGLTEIEKQSATPLFSNFKKGTLFIQRLLKVGWRLLAGTADKRSKDDVNLDRGLTAQKHFGINGIVEGHTHHARFDSFITTEEKGFQRMNTHTWMSKEGKWGRPTVTWGEEGRGVGVIEIGTDKGGNKWTEMRLDKVTDESGGLVRGDLYMDAEAEKLKYKRLKPKVDAIYRENNAAPAQPLGKPVTAS